MGKHISQKSKNRDLITVIAVICAAILVALVIVVVSRASSGGGAQTDSCASGTADGVIETTAAETEVTAGPDTDDILTDEPADTTDIPADTQSDEPAYTNPPFTPDTNFNYNSVPQGSTNDMSALSKSVFIGDSRTEGLKLYTSLSQSGARIYSSVGMMVNNALTDNIVTHEGKKMTLPAALSDDPDFDSVYIMLGINELGWVYTQSYIDGYAKLIDAVRAVNPDAKIYIQSLLPVTKELSDVDPVFHNGRIEEFNKALSQLAAQKGVLYLNVAEAFSADDGSLPAEASSDGVHLSKAYCNKWLEYILNHRV